MSAETNKSNRTSLSQKTKDTYKAHIIAWERSSLTQTVYCQKNNINKRTFSYLRHQLLSTRANHQNKNAFIPIISAPQDKALKPCEASDIIIIRLSNNTRIEIPANIEQKQLATLINLVRIAP